jgi:hypothetical protein
MRRKKRKTPRDPLLKKQRERLCRHDHRKQLCPFASLSLCEAIAESVAQAAWG